MALSWLHSIALVHDKRSGTCRGPIRRHRWAHVLTKRHREVQAYRSLDWRQLEGLRNVHQTKAPFPFEFKVSALISEVVWSSHFPDHDPLDRWRCYPLR